MRKIDNNVVIKERVVHHRYLEMLRQYVFDHSEGLTQVAKGARRDKVARAVQDIVMGMVRINPIIINEKSEAFMIRVLDACIMCGILDKMNDISKCKDLEFIKSVHNKVEELGVDYQNTIDYCIKVYDDLDRMSHIRAWKKADIYHHSRKLQKVIFYLDNNKVVFSKSITEKFRKWNYKFSTFIASDNIKNV